MSRDFIIGCVGKPSSGKSTFFNAACINATAKAAAYPFTTIEPNQGVAYFTTQCPCLQYGVKCKPNFGTCKNGIRKVPVKLLDVAGLIPGAHEGRGIGNKFLDDLRHANVLLHIIDVTGNTNEKGEATIGYDPSNDHEWLVQEIELWVYNRLVSKWASLSRRHELKNANVVTTLQSQLSGYMANESLIKRVLDLLQIRTDHPVDLRKWTLEQIRNLTRVFVQERFKFVLVLNKADSGYIEYSNDSNDFYMYGDSQDSNRNSKLKHPDEKLKRRLENIRDLVIYRFGSTGVVQAINTAIIHAGMICVYPIRNLKTYGMSDKEDCAFPQVELVYPSTV
ncbi:bifunctional P-loop containing nucleoside triphosphate hydrolase/GTP binding domain/OBG-type guanine nucleotide-binding (G) domain/Uncharacterized GTP-binding protein [Babesia duncani]|uniref:Bifunctional P-loop containing nucleoside triphosphate hydrolase/GTP binding domain/OBG-type guanine nucleotide-binding (G) domain/Uncharacterized GTP-binding protein n=1 Tax=Babesia duncani TaxID=323732 RepID=A0AAD9UNQ7_9APIC|nr:bifunctional P-loop containing nucleoside triphosphate hydrolase/GTP binding domain/OBG-type guanine nucleotide-binding (G) domain/Uncharacterized GTP-binding protein [Babesia duncani]